MTDHLQTQPIAGALWLFCDTCKCDLANRPSLPTYTGAFVCPKCAEAAA